MSRSRSACRDWACLAAARTPGSASIPRFRGFGGEEFYIHEKFRQAGHKCWCLPWLRWLHRFGRPQGVPYPNTFEDRIWNYLVGWSELGLPLDAIYEHFLATLPAGMVAAWPARLGRDISISVKDEASDREITMPLANLPLAA